MPYSLKDRAVLITGGGRGLGAEVARRFAAEGAHVAINYISSAEPAQRLATELSTTHSIRAITIQGDGGNPADCARCVAETVAAFGGIDVIIGNAGWTRFSDFNDLAALSYEEWGKAFGANVLGHHALVKAAMPTFNKNEEGGVVVLTSSVAGKSIAGSSMAYSVTKAAQLHLVKCLAQSQGAKLRVNAVLPGLLLTDWGNLYGEERIRELSEQAALKKTTDVGECADAYVFLAKNTSITGQFFHVDAGLAVQHL